MLLHLSPGKRDQACSCLAQGHSLGADATLQRWELIFLPGLWRFRGQWCRLLRVCLWSISQAWSQQSSHDRLQISILSWPHPDLLEAGDVTQSVRELIKLLDDSFLKLTFNLNTSLKYELWESLGIVFWEVEALARDFSWMDELEALLILTQTIAVLSPTPALSPTPNWPYSLRPPHINAFCSPHSCQSAFYNSIIMKCLCLETFRESVFIIDEVLIP